MSSVNADIFPLLIAYMHTSDDDDDYTLDSVFPFKTHNFFYRGMTSERVADGVRVEIRYKDHGVPRKSPSSILTLVIPDGQEHVTKEISDVDGFRTRVVVSVYMGCVLLRFLVNKDYFFDQDHVEIGKETRRGFIH